MDYTYGSPDNRSEVFRLQDFDRSSKIPIVRLALLVLAVFIFLIAINWARTFYTEWLWFDNLGYASVLLKRVTTQLWLYLLGAVIVAILAAPNLYAAFGSTAKMPRDFGEGVSPRDYREARRFLLWGAIAVLTLLALIMAGSLAANWENVLLFLDGVPFGETDPIFNKNISFYIFTLPILDFARIWLLALLVLIVLVVVAFHYFIGTLWRIESRAGRKLRSHLLVLGSLIFLLIAAGHWLERYHLLNTITGAVYGVGFTADHITIPARTFLTGVALVSAGILLAAVFMRGNGAIYVALGGWFLLLLLAVNLVPGLVQRFHVEPSELARERPYVANNIRYTRQAFGLDRVQTRSHPARGNVESAEIAKNQGTIQNIRLWDEGPLLQSYNQIQFFRLYYDFLAVQTDRYRVNGDLRQVMVATRELSAEKLPAEAQRWVNRHLQFTHGYGVAMSPVTEIQPGGRPAFLIRDVPPKGVIPLERPEIYYGLKSLDFLIVRSEMSEFNYTGPEGPVYTHYDGEGGVPLRSFFRRLLYAWRFWDINILISSEINPDSRIQYHRTISERFATITPFLLRDGEAYCVVADGRLFFIQDAYTVSDRYPYSTPWQGRMNYMRNSVKAVVDTYNGKIDYYVYDPADPIIRTYDAIFPGLFKPATEMPEYLRPHIRYPIDLFTVQTQMLLQYHMKDPVVFYNKEDQWSIPGQTSFGQAVAMRPYYIVARLPEMNNEEFILIQPFTPNNRHNLVGWIAARNDGKHCGELDLFRFPTGRHVDGPNQVEARIDNDAVISEQFTLWGQVGSEVYRGNLLVIPIGDSILYAEPVFLKPVTLDFPELRRIILADSEQVVMHPTLADSVDALVGALPPVALPSEKVPPGEPPPEEPGELEALRQSLNDAIDTLRDVADRLGRMSR